jgi:hypothetical protein
MDIPAETLDKFSTKERTKEKYNKTNGQIDNLKKYTTISRSSSSQFANPPTVDKQIRREANFLKNIHIDEALDHLKSSNLVNGDKYDAWWCGTMHTLGVAFVMAQAELCLSKKEVRSPAGLFHHLINKALNKANDPHLPRFN